MIPSAKFSKWKAREAAVMDEALARRAAVEARIRELAAVPPRIRAISEFPLSFTRQAVQSRQAFWREDIKIPPRMLPSTPCSAARAPHADNDTVFAVTDTGLNLASDNFPMCSDKDDYFVVASRLVPYKRIDLIVDAFKEMPNRRLVVLGDGPEMKRLKLRAGPNVVIKGHVSRTELIDVVSHAKAFIFASYEDFGIVMAEAQAAGTPVLAFQRGGALDIVRTGKTECPTGMFFAEQSTEAIKDVVERFILQQSFITPQACSENARRFSIENFCSRLTEIIDVTLDPNFNRDLRILPATISPTAGPRMAESRRLYLGDSNLRLTGRASGKSW